MADRSSEPKRIVAVVALGPRPLAESDLSGIERLTRAGVLVRLVSWTSPRPRLAALLDDIVVLGPGRRSPPASAARVVADNPAPADAVRADVPPPPPPPARRRGIGRAVTVGVRAARSPRRYGRRARQLARRRMRRMPRVTAAADTAQRNWRMLLSKSHTLVATTALASNRRARSILTSSDALVAADVPSLPVVWTLARRRSAVPALFGLSAASSRLTPAPAPGATRVTGPRPRPDRSARTRR